MKSLVESILSSTKTGKYIIGTPIEIEGKKGVVVYNDGKEFWVLSDYIRYQSGTLVRLPVEERGRYCKDDGWYLMTALDVKKIDFKNKFTYDQLSLIFPERKNSIWLDSGKILSMVSLSANNRAPYSTHVIKLLKKFKI